MSRISFLLLYDDFGQGPRILSSILKSHGHTTTITTLHFPDDIFAPVSEPIIDPKYKTPIGCSKKELELLLDLLGEQRPDWVGISVVSRHNHLAAYLSARIRESLSVPLVWGGIDATVNPDLAIQHADVVCLGEAEQTIHQLNEAVAGKGRLADVPGIWFRDTEGIHKNPPQEPVSDLDSLPFPDYDLADYTLITGDRVVRREYDPRSNLRLGIWPILTARGCPFRCSYCCNGIEDPEIPFPRTVRLRSPEHVAREMAWVRNRQPHVREIYITDEIFGLDLKWTQKLAEQLTGKKRFELSSCVYPNCVKPQWIRLFREVGGAHVFMGVQSGSDRVNREVFNRKTTGEQILRACRELVDAGLPPLIEIIGRNPYQTEDDLREAAEFMTKLPRPFRLWTIFPLQFYRNYALANRAFRDNVALEPLNDCTWLAKETPEIEFQDAFIFFLGMMDLPKEAALTMLQDELWRRKPEVLGQLNEVLKPLFFHFLRSNICIPKTDYIAQLERELATLRGSRMVRNYLAAKGRLKHILGK
jgi:radical SAM superfamily enzyme YgiQ (UPF0313 family)